MVVGEGRLSFGRWFQIDWGPLSSPSFCSLWRSLMIWLMVCWFVALGLWWGFLDLGSRPFSPCCRYWANRRRMWRGEVLKCVAAWLVVIAPSVTARTMARFFEYDMLEITGFRTNDLGHQKSFSLLQADTSPERS